MEDHPPVEFSKLIALVKALPEQVSSVSVLKKSSKHFELLALLLDDTERLVKDGRLSLYGHNGELNAIGLACIALNDVILSVDCLLKGKPRTVAQSVKKFLTHRDPVKKKSRCLIADLNEAQLNFTMAVMQSCTTCSQYDAIKGSVDQLQRWLQEDYPDDTMISEADTIPSARCLEVKPTRLFQRDPDESSDAGNDVDGLPPSTDPEYNVDTMSRWIDGAEGRAQRMVTATSIVLQRKPLLDIVQDQKILMADINQHKSVVDSLNNTLDANHHEDKPDTNDHTPTEHRLTDHFRKSVDDINRRFDAISKLVHEYGDHLDTLSYKLNDFENEVGELENWMLPLIDGLKSSYEISMFSLVESDNKLKEHKCQFDERKAALKRINEIGEELIAYSSSNDTTHVTSVLNNVNATWKTLSDTLVTRTQQYEDLLKAKENYDVTHGNVNDWLSSMEHRLDELIQLDSIDTLDAIVVQELLNNLKLLYSEVTDYKSKINDNSVNENTVEMLTTPSPVKATQLCRSAALGLKTREALMKQKRSSTGFTIEISMQQDVINDTQRYDDLLRRIQLALTQLELSNDWLRHTDDLKVNQDWVTSCEERVEQITPPCGNDYPYLCEHIKVLKSARKVIRSHRARITESVHEADYFLRSSHEKLSQQRRDELRKRLDDLRERFSNLDINSEETLQNAFEKIESYQLESGSLLSYASSEADLSVNGDKTKKGKHSPEKDHDNRPPWNNLF